MAPLAVNVREAADTLGISERSVRYEVTAGRLRSFKYGTRTLIPTAALDEWVAARLEQNA